MSSSMEVVYIFHTGSYLVIIICSVKYLLNVAICNTYCVFRLWPTLHLDPLSPREVRSAVNAECQNMDLKFTKDQVSYRSTNPPFFFSIFICFEFVDTVTGLFSFVSMSRDFYLFTRRRSWKGTVALHQPAMHCMSHYWPG